MTKYTAQSTVCNQHYITETTHLIHKGSDKSSEEVQNYSQRETPVDGSTLHLSINRVLGIVTYERSGQLDDEGKNREQEGKDLEKRDIDNDRDEWSGIRSRARESVFTNFKCEMEVHDTSGS